MAVGDIAKLEIQFTYGAQLIRPGLHFQVAEGNQVLSTLISSWRGSCETAMLAAMGSNIQLTGYDAVDVRPGLLATRHEEVAPPLTGATAGDLLPPQDAVLMSFKTDSKSPRARGRIYWPGMTETDSFNGGVDAPGVAKWDALIAAMTANYIGTTPVSGWRLVNFSGEQLKAPKPPPVFVPREGDVITPVNNIVLDTIIRSQRRRQIGVGR
jgi:hypothetical protein